MLGLDIETLPAGERVSRLCASEEKKWDEEYYMCVLAGRLVLRALTDQPGWTTYRTRRSKVYSSGSTRSTTASLTRQKRWHSCVFPDENVRADKSEDETCDADEAADLIDAGQARQLHVTLVSILFSYFYDARATGHEPTSESAWTISALTPCFVALCTHATVAETVLASYRRALCYPLYRSFALCERVRKDVGTVLGLGVKAVMHALLETRRILAGHDVYYVYSKIWVEDYCVWVARHAT